MKYRFILVAFLWHTGAMAKTTDSLPVPSCRPATCCVFSPIQSPQKNIVVAIRCQATISHAEPLVILDGVVIEMSYIGKIDPAIIESVDVLKNAAATAIYGHQAARGAIIITTKKQVTGTLIIRDSLTREGIPAATILFLSKDKTFKAVSDSNGAVATGKLKPGVNYDVLVSSAGYKSLRASITGKSQDLLLQKDIRDCPEVVVKAFGCIRRSIMLICGITGVTRACGIVKTPVANANAPAKVRLYPNPAMRNQSFTIEFVSECDEQMQLSVISMSGNVVLSQAQKAVKAFNRITLAVNPAWATGIYIVQLSNDRGEVVRKEKLVIQ